MHCLKPNNHSICHNISKARAELSKWKGQSASHFCAVPTKKLSADTMAWIIHTCSATVCTVTCKVTEMLPTAHVQVYKPYPHVQHVSPTYINPM